MLTSVVKSWPALQIKTIISGIIDMEVHISYCKVVIWVQYLNLLDCFPDLASLIRKDGKKYFIC